MCSDFPALKRFFIFVFLLHSSVYGTFAQSPVVNEYADTLNALARRMQRGENDSIRLASANVFHYYIEMILRDSTSFHAPFEAIKNVSAKTAPDHKFRIYTWQFPNYDGSVYRYYGYLQTVNVKTKKISLITLLDYSRTIEKPLSKKLKPDHWYGAVYYDIIENSKGKKKYYTLFGWHGKDNHTTQKIIDVLSFEGGNPIFGRPVFKAKDIYHNRVIFEFASQAVMSVRYVPDRKLIVFDHLSSTNKKSEPRLSRMIGPDGSYDAFKFKKGHWELVEDVDVDNGFVPKKKEVRLYKDDELWDKK